MVASPTQVRILAGAEVIATPPRRYDQAAPIEQPAHLDALTAIKRQARYHRGQDRLAQATPASRQWLSAAAERGQPLGAITAAWLERLEQYGAAELEAAIMAALQQDVPHPHAVRLGLQRRREQRGQTPPLALALPADHRVRDIVVRPHALQDYDQLQAHPEHADDDPQ